MKVVQAGITDDEGIVEFSDAFEACFETEEAARRRGSAEAARNHREGRSSTFACESPGGDD